MAEPGLYPTYGDVTASPRRTAIVTPSDTVNLDYLTRTIRSNIAGVITVVNQDGTTCACNFLAGETRVMCVKRVNNTGTTGGNTIEAGF